MLTLCADDSRRRGLSSRCDCKELMTWNGRRLSPRCRASGAGSSTQRVKAIRQAGPVGEVSQPRRPPSRATARRVLRLKITHHQRAAETHSVSVAAFSCQRGPAVGGARSPMEPLRGTPEPAKSACGVEVGGADPIFASATEGRPQQQEACRHRGRTCRPGHEPRHRRQATIPSRQTPHYPGKRAETSRSQRSCRPGEWSEKLMW